MSLFTNISISLTCDRYYENRSNILEQHSKFEGIPETLLFNIVSCLVLIILFAVLRKIAWNYGRIALLSRKEQCIDKRLNEGWTTLFYGRKEEKDERHDCAGSVDSLERQAEHHDQGLNWFAVVFRLKDDHIARACGQDAVQYLKFQEHLIVFMAVVALLSLAVILPINYAGGQASTSHIYAHSTISNIDTNSATLWIHALLALFYLLLAILVMRRFSAKLNIDSDEDVSSTLMVSFIPKDKCFKNTITEHFKEAYPDQKIEDVQFAFNIRMLAKHDKALKVAHEGRTTSEMLCNATGSRPVMVPYYFGRLCCCCQRCGCRLVDAIDYYSSEEHHLEILIESEKANAFQECTGIAFVTFETQQMAQKVYYDYNRGSCRRNQPKHSALSNDLDSRNWDVQFSPDPVDVNWENLSLTPFIWWFKAICINGVLVLVLFFLTTPTVLLNGSGRDPRGSDMQNAFTSQFVPSVLLWFFSVMLPWLVYYSDQFIGHWTKTQEHHTVMQKTFVFLLLMVVILPSLGLTSAKAFLEYMFSHGELRRIQWRCIFLPGNGAFFVNFVITNAFIGNALTLMRLPELLMYVLRLAAARSAYEQSAVRRAVVWDFQFGQDYAWMLCVFCVVMAYCISNPLVAPFGLLYFVGKHYADRYNLYYAYKPSKINRHIHTSAINYVIIAAIILQFNMLFFNLLRTSWQHGLPVFSGLVVTFSVVFFMGRLLFGWFKNWAPIKYRQFENKENWTAHTQCTEQDNQRVLFMPDVLMEARKDNKTLYQGQGQNDVTEEDEQAMDHTEFVDPEFVNTDLRNEYDDQAESSQSECSD